MTKKSIYVAGPMSGYPNFNFPAFFEAADKLRKEGWIVYNPANKEDEAIIGEEAMKTGDLAKAQAQGFNFRDAYRWDIECVIKADAIYMLPGWEDSPGARGEHAVAVAMKRHYPDYEIIYA